MSSIQEHQTATASRLREQVRTVAEKFALIESRYRERILELLAVTTSPIDFVQLIHADRALSGCLGGLSPDHLRQLCEALFGAGLIDMKQDGDRLLVFGKAQEPTTRTS